MNIKKMILRLALLYATIVLISSCDDGVAETGNYEYEEWYNETDSPAPEIEEDSTVYDDDADEYITTEESDTEDPIEEQGTMLSAISEDYDGYVMIGSKLYGLSGSSIEEISIQNTDGEDLTLTGFYKEDGVFYFSVEESTTDDDGVVSTDEYYYSQDDGEISSIEEDSFSEPDQGAGYL